MTTTTDFLIFYLVITICLLAIAIVVLPTMVRGPKKTKKK